jgi:hypothetical protein
MGEGQVLLYPFSWAIHQEEVLRRTPTLGV